MGSNKEAQAARNAADRRLREEYPQAFEAFMHEEHEARGLTWNRRPSKEERERRALEVKQAKAKARILRDAQSAGIDVSFVTHDAEAEQERLNAEAPDLAWNDMSEEQRRAVAGTRAPRSDAEEAMAWGESD